MSTTTSTRLQTLTATLPRLAVVERKAALTAGAAWLRAADLRAANGHHHGGELRRAVRTYEAAEDEHEEALAALDAARREVTRLRVALRLEGV